MSTLNSVQRKNTAKNILYFMPDCPTAFKAGNITHSLKVLHYLNETAITNTVDFLSLSDWGTWSEESINKFHTLFPNINLILLNRKIDKKKHPIKSILFYKIPNFIIKLFKKKSIDISNPFLNNKVTKLFNSKVYDNIIISYATWSSFVDNINYKSHLILDSHDFITAQSKHKTNKIGHLFQSEMKAARKFDEIWTFSIEEKYIFEQFTKSKVTYLPFCFHKKEITPLQKIYKYEVLYVASINPHNYNSMQWFISEVLPLLSKDIRIHVVGKIGETIEEHPNIIIHGMVEDLQEYYDNARITICPMLSGTGVKIKVLESLNNNIPVVTNTRGVDGLVQKKNNGCLVTEDAQEFASSIKKLLSDDLFYVDMVKQAHNYITDNHNLDNEIQFYKQKFS
ncbi:glycosyltransferase [Sphingobacterium rhinopitheci]|uniref:glycosyltransferase n=1 Tax=Sphingobacterium rhinopitheci TaxID=2781960 RepID=UPI001F524986|nr:glycosyltransferase [Sphingobacterium rhinopitheci]MCI0920713.1 glycosyltransferase family 4 protein [Sphingobacterium rhinopitheci]